MVTLSKNSQNTYSIVTGYGNLVATKKFPTESLLEIIDSSTKNLGEVKYDRKLATASKNPSSAVNLSNPENCDFII